MIVFSFPPQGSDNLTTYTFNTHAAKHTFCKTCGVQSFYTPRSNPDGYGNDCLLQADLHHNNHMYCSRDPFVRSTKRTQTKQSTIVLNACFSSVLPQFPSFSFIFTFCHLKFCHLKCFCFFFVHL